MRKVFIVTYDICHDKRLRQTYQLMRAYGDHLQYSVFRCELDDKEKVELIMKLTDIINKKEDQVLFFSLGSAGSKTEQKIESLGVPYVERNKSAIVI